MRVMTGRAWGLLALNMFLMLLKALVTQYAATVMTFITKGIRGRAFYGVILCCIVSFKKVSVI